MPEENVGSGAAQNGAAAEAGKGGQSPKPENEANRRSRQLAANRQLPADRQLAANRQLPGHRQLPANPKPWAVFLTPGAAKVLYCTQTFGQSAVLCANFSKVWTQHSTFDLGTGPGVSGSCGEFRVFGRRRRGRFWGPRGDFLVYTKHRIQA